MKTAIYIEDGVIQLVITPESKFEKNSMKTFEDKEMDCKLFSGSFYDCRGGWIRQSSYYSNSMISGDNKDDRSLIITLKEQANEQD